jgi:phosphosulfolactate phosphohydrolase-like enzyme
MTLAQIEYAEQRMQKQWRDLVMAEQEGQPLEALEQMYDIYILLAEEFNAYVQAYQSGRSFLEAA